MSNAPITRVMSCKQQVDENSYCVIHFTEWELEGISNYGINTREAFF